MSNTNYIGDYIAVTKEQYAVLEELHAWARRVRTRAKNRTIKYRKLYPNYHEIDWPGSNAPAVLKRVALLLKKAYIDLQ